jgi:hypothetical protein
MTFPGILSLAVIVLGASERKYTAKMGDAPIE